MKKLAAALDQEKKKTDMLLYQMLPVKVANQLRDGRTVEAGNNQWPFSQKFLQFLVRFSVKNFVREILRAFHERIRSLLILRFHLRETLP